MNKITDGIEIPMPPILDSLFYLAVETFLHPRSVEHRPPFLAPDGYIRLSLASLASISFVHLFSENDTEFLHELRAQTIPARSAGFSEWKSKTSPVISLGWGWFIHAESGKMLLAPDGVRSNVMLIDACGYDLGAIKTSNLFCTWLSEFSWQNEVSKGLSGVVACQL